MNQEGTETQVQVEVNNMDLFVHLTSSGSSCDRLLSAQLLNELLSTQDRTPCLPVTTSD